uniref:Uncharacterized protein n=1 Tax=Glossina palpalis gambiensis TaxID=67801 RepID=A0A1B0C6I5_9MUSC
LIDKFNSRYGTNYNKKNQKSTVRCRSRRRRKHPKCNINKILIQLSSALETYSNVRNDKIGPARLKLTIQAKPSQAKLSQVKQSQAKPSQAKPSNNNSFLLPLTCITRDITVRASFQTSAAILFSAALTVLLRDTLDTKVIPEQEKETSQILRVCGKKAIIEILLRYTL